jgi:hypothetical protein
VSTLNFNVIPVARNDLLSCNKQKKKKTMKNSSKLSWKMSFFFFVVSFQLDAMNK